MSWQAMTAVSRHSTQTNISLFRLLLYLAEHANATGAIEPAPNQVTMAARFDCSVRTIRNRINSLCADGELVQTKIGSGPGNPSAYQILLPMPELAEEEGGKAETNTATLSAFDDKGGKTKAEKAEANTIILSAFAEIKAEISNLKAEISSLKAERKGGKGGKSNGERRKGHSTKSADDPYLIQSDPYIDPEEKREKIPSPPLAEMVNALAEVTFLDGHMNWGALSTLAGELMGAYSPQQILLHYGAGQSLNGHWYWYAHDWRGQKDEPPTPNGIRKTIKQAVAGIIPKPKSPTPAPQTAAQSYQEVFT